MDEGTITSRHVSLGSVTKREELHCRSGSLVFVLCYLGVISRCYSTQSRPTPPAEHTARLARLNQATPKTPTSESVRSIN